MTALKRLLAAAIAAALLAPATASAATDGVKHITRPKVKWHGYGFLPGYHQPPALSDWRDRSVRFGGARRKWETRFYEDGEWRYGWGGPGFTRSRYNGGTIGPCWRQTPIGAIWTCGN